jgi:hypothetical protein
MDMIVAIIQPSKLEDVKKSFGSGWHSGNDRYRHERFWSAKGRPLAF